jgi:hypothetical protein
LLNWNISIVLMMKISLLTLILLVNTCLGSSIASASDGFLLSHKQVASAWQEIFPNGTSLGEQDPSIPIWPVYQVGQLIGYIFASIDFIQMPGFSGEPVNLLIGIDTQGNFVGALHPQLQQQLDIPHTVYLFEIMQDSVTDVRLPSFNPLSRFPEVRRDLAVIVDQEISVADIQSQALNVAGEELIKLKVFDVYIGKGIDSHRKSVALGLTFQHLSRTLTDNEINDAIYRVIEALKENFNAELR